MCMQPAGSERGSWSWWGRMRLSFKWCIRGLYKILITLGLDQRLKSIITSSSSKKIWLRLTCECILIHLNIYFLFELSQFIHPSIHSIIIYFVLIVFWKTCQILSFKHGSNSGKQMIFILMMNKLKFKELNP